MRFEIQKSYLNFVASRMRHYADATLPPPWQKPERWQDLAWVMAMMENGNYPMEVEPMLKGWCLTPREMTAKKGVARNRNSLFLRRFRMGLNLNI